jgi:hypothetical protein
MRVLGTHVAPSQCELAPHPALLLAGTLLVALVVPPDDSPEEDTTPAEVAAWLLHAAVPVLDGTPVEVDGIPAVEVLPPDDGRDEPVTHTLAPLGPLPLEDGAFSNEEPDAFTFPEETPPVVWPGAHCPSTHSSVPVQSDGVLHMRTHSPPLRTVPDSHCVQPHSPTVPPMTPTASHAARER